MLYTLDIITPDGLYAKHINPQWVRLLSLLQMNVSYSHCLGAEIFSGDGRRFLDFLSGYCVHRAQPPQNRGRVEAGTRPRWPRHAPESRVRAGRGTGEPPL